MGRMMTIGEIMDHGGMKDHEGTMGHGVTMGFSFPREVGRLNSAYIYPTTTLLGQGQCIFAQPEDSTQPWGMTCLSVTYAITIRRRERVIL